MTYVRKNVHDAAPYYVSNLVPAWVGLNTVSVTRTIGDETFNLVDVPDAVAGDTAVEYHELPRRELQLRHD